MRFGSAFLRVASVVRSRRRAGLWSPLAAVVRGGATGGRPTVEDPGRRRDMVHVKGLRSLVDDYDIFVLDQYGVLHNGEQLLDGVTVALEALSVAGKRLVVLSNTSRRLSILLDELPRRGFKREWLSGAVCSGEECYQALRRDWTGKKVLMLGWQRDDDDLRYLEGTGTTLANDATEADCVVAHGPDTIYEHGAYRPTGFRKTGDVGPYEHQLKLAAARALPMLVANPDQITLQRDEVFHMPGTIADRYRALGGPVVEYGKPSADHFKAAVDLCNLKNENQRVIHVGDSLKHDVLGAHNAKVDSLFVVDTGVHSRDLADCWGASNNPDDAIRACAAKYGTPLPTHFCATFTW